MQKKEKGCRDNALKKKKLTWRHERTRVFGAERPRKCLNGIHTEKNPAHERAAGPEKKKLKTEMQPLEQKLEGAWWSMCPRTNRPTKHFWARTPKEGIRIVSFS